MTLRKLRSECHDWSWRAERIGMGWRYIGSRDGSTVTVQAWATLCGPLDDDYATIWRADDGKTSMSYAMWQTKHACR